MNDSSKFPHQHITSQAAKNLTKNLGKMRRNMFKVDWAPNLSMYPLCIYSKSSAVTKFLLGIKSDEDDRLMHYIKFLRGIERHILYSLTTSQAQSTYPADMENLIYEIMTKVIEDKHGHWLETPWVDVLSHILFYKKCNHYDDASLEKIHKGAIEKLEHRPSHITPIISIVFGALLIASGITLMATGVGFLPGALLAGTGVCCFLGGSLFSTRASQFSHIPKNNLESIKNIAFIGAYIEDWFKIADPHYGGPPEHYMESGSEYPTRFSHPTRIGTLLQNKQITEAKAEVKAYLDGLRDIVRSTKEETHSLSNELNDKTPADSASKSPHSSTPPTKK